MKKLIIFSFLLVFYHGNSVFAQDSLDFTADDNSQAIATYGLEECIKFALKNSEKLKKANYQVQISDKEVSERLSAGYPKVDLRAGIEYNYLIQKSVFDKESSAYQTFANSLPDPKPDFITVAFSVPYASRFNLTLEQLVFDFAYLIGIKAARSYVELGRKQIKQNQIDITANVSKAYYAVLINQERLDLLALNYLRLDTIFDNTSVLYKNGLAEKIDVLRTEVALNNAKTEREKLLQLQDLTMKILKFQMGMAVRDSLTLQGSLRDMNLEVNNFLKEEGNYENRIEYEILQQNRLLQEINLKYNKSLYLPRLTASANYGALTNSSTFGNLWKFQERWFTFGAVGLNFSMPIIDGFKRRHTVGKLKLEILKVEEDLKLLKRTVELETEEAQINVQTYLKDLEIQKRNMELSQEVTKLAVIKYQNGVGSTLEIVNAQASFKEAENNYFNALYNVIISKVDLEKATGKLKTDY